MFVSMRGLSEFIAFMYEMIGRYSLPYLKGTRPKGSRLTELALLPPKCLSY